MQSSVTLGQIQKLLSLLVGVTSEQVQKALESGHLTEIIRNGDISAVQEKIALQNFRANCIMVMKVVSPEDIIVTRPREVCTYYNDSRKGKYQMKFWVKQFGYPKMKGHVSENRADYFLFEFYSSHPQPVHLRYPMENDDLSNMEPRGYAWYKEEVTLNCGQEKVTIDVFRMKKMS